MNSTNLAYAHEWSARGETQGLSNQQRDSNDSYAQILRVIGQQLEPLKPQAFDIVRSDRCYLARCLTKPAGSKGRGVPTFLQTAERQQIGPGRPGGPFAANLELMYTAKDIWLLEEQGRARRRNPRGLPEPYSLANMLRAIGWFLDDQNGARLISASYHAAQDNIVNIIYETAKGVRRVEEFTTFVLYDFWVKWYLRKKQQLQPV